MRNKTRKTTRATGIQHIIGSPSHSNQIRKEIKRDLDWKGSRKFMTVCR